MQLTINDTDYNFRFGIGFVNKLDQKNIITRENIKFGAGLELSVGKVLDQSVPELAEILLTANATEVPKLQKKDLYDYIDDENTDIEELFNEVTEELKNSNATKLKVAKVIEEAEKQRRIAEMQQRLLEKQLC
jgi:hypothetical protein